MSTNAPWSVKGIDARVREVAKTLARQNGMTLGEWLNKMILEGQDVNALIREEQSRSDIQEDKIGRSPASGAGRDLRRSIFADRPRAQREPDMERDYDGVAVDLGRVAQALERLGSRIESSESRSADAVMGVSHAVESVLDRLERTQDAPLSHERGRRNDPEPSALTARLEQAERLLDAQSERLDGISGHVREERERLARIEAEAKGGEVLNTVKQVEGTLGKLANQLYENDTRTRDSLTDMREQFLGLSHRLSQVEQQDPERTAQNLIDKVVVRLAGRLENAEVQTQTALRKLERDFAALDARMGAMSELPGVDQADQGTTFARLAAEMSLKVDAAREDLFKTLNDGSLDSLQKLEARIAAAETRSARAIETLGQDVLRMAEGLNRKITTVDANARASATRATQDMRRLTEAVEGRFNRSESGHAQALERLGSEIARISERLNVRLTETERRTSEIKDSVSQEWGQHREGLREEFSERIRASEERTQKWLDEARARLDQKVAQGLTQSLLNEVVVKPQVSAAAPASDALYDPFTAPLDAVALSTPATPALRDATQDTPELDGFDDDVHAVAQPMAQPVSDADTDLDLTEALLDPLTDNRAKAVDYDPFGDESFDDIVPGAVSSAPSPSQSQAPAEADMAEDDDPFADLDQTHRSAPAAMQPPISRFSDDDDGVSMSTRDALAAARAAVRASLEGGETRSQSALGSLKPAARTRDTRAESQKGGGTLFKAFKASSVAVVAVGVATTGYLGVQTYYPELLGGQPKATTPIAAAVVVPEATTEAAGAEQQRLREQYAEARQALTARSEDAVDKIKAVANLGYAPAQYRLASIYRGEGKLEKPNAVEARQWMQKAANGGVRAAMYWLGIMYYNGDGGAQDQSMAAMWFRKAAERGYINAQYNLGLMYQSGTGVPVNPAEAYKWMSIAANSGDADARKGTEELKALLTEAQQAKADEFVTNFTPISDAPTDIAQAD